MNLDEMMLDILQRMVRVEEKVDALREDKVTQRNTRLQVYLALVGSATAIGIAVLL